MELVSWLANSARSVSQPFVGQMAPLVMNIDNWFSYLDKAAGVISERKISMLKTSLVDGVDIGLEAGVVPSALKLRRCRNLKSASGLEQEVKLLSDLKKEVELGRRLGPFKEPPCPSLQCSPVGTVPKKHSDKLRIILHLSYPRDRSGTSINSQVKKLKCHLMKFKSAIKEVRRRGKGCLLAKFDIKDAFRLIRVRPDQQSLLGLEFMDCYFIDLVLPFGLTSAPRLFEVFATAIEKFIKGEGVEWLKHYLDDFLLISHGDNKLRAMVEYRTVLRVFAELGVELAKEKLSKPSTKIEFLGIIIDTEEMTMSLPPDKLERYRLLLDKLRDRKVISIEELQSLIGVLVYSSAIIQSGSSFYYHLRRMLEEAKGDLVGDPTEAPIPLSAGALREIEWWSTFIVAWNGKNLISPLSRNFIPHDVHRMYTDACQTGMGAWFEGDSYEYVAHVWDKTELRRAQREERLSMPYLELLALTHGVGVWREKLQGKAILINSDCLGVVHMIKKGYSPHGEAMILLRQLAYFKALHNIFIKVVHIEGAKNVVADCLSRLPSSTTELTDDDHINFESFFELPTIKRALQEGSKPLIRRQIKSFPKMNWNGLLRSSRRAQSQ